MPTEGEGANAARDSLPRFDVAWPAFLAQYAQFLGTQLDAAHVLLLVRSEAAATWRVAGRWSAESGDGASPPAEMVRELRTLTEDGGIPEFEARSIEIAAAKSAKGRSETLVAAQIPVDGTGGTMMAGLLLPGAAEKRTDALRTQLPLLRLPPRHYLANRQVGKLQDDLRHFAVALDLLVLLNDRKRFMAAAMTVCNELARHLACNRVSLGWLKGNYLRLEAISHTEKFERKMDAVRRLETVMEECLDQDCEIVVPPSDEADFVAREHGQFARETDDAALCSAPLRVDGKPVAVVTCERGGDQPFSDSDVALLRLCVDQVSRRLDDLHRTDRWFGARWVAWSREKLGRLIGVEHTGAKLVAIIVCAVLAFLIFGRMEYRVEAPFTVRSDVVAYVPCPYDGYIADVHVRIGDVVKKGAPLLDLDTRDLLLEKATQQAERNRWRQERERARANDSPAEMRIAQARLEQVETQLELLEHRLAQATLAAPKTGIVVRQEAEGELTSRIGAPVRRGDTLVKIASLEELYAECRVDERDVQQVAPGATGQVAFAGNPEEKIPIQVVRVDPSAEAREEGNAFVTRCRFADADTAHYRPGMTGVSKINAGRRSILWIFTHRTLDFLRMKLWW